MDNFSESESSKMMGDRLTELRRTLSKISGVDYSQDRLAKELGVKQGVIARLEKGNGAIDNLIKVLLFYHNQGFNIQWIIIPDNEKVSMYRQMSEIAPDNAQEPNPELYQTFMKLGKMIFGNS